jgi:hypothetical protein
MLGVHNPVFTVLRSVVRHSFLHLFSESLDDHSLEFTEPDINFLLDLDLGGQWDSFSFLGLHVSDLNVVDNGNFNHTIEHSLEVLLHNGGIVRLSEDFQDFIIRQEIEARECVSLALHVVVQGGSNLLEEQVLGHNVLIRDLGLLYETRDGRHLSGLHTHRLEEFINLVEIVSITLERFSELSRGENVLKVDPVFLESDPGTNDIVSILDVFLERLTVFSHETNKSVTEDGVDISQSFINLIVESR